MLKIRQIGDPVLGCHAENVEEIDSSLAVTCLKMFEMMAEAGGVGLAATQVGILRRFFVYDRVAANSDVADSEAEQLNSRMCVMINPVVISGSGSAENSEGCLSVPCEPQKIVRSEHVLVEALTLSSERISVECEGLLARLIQHEIDHLDGLLISDRLPSSEKYRLLRQISQNMSVFAQPASTVFI